MPPAVQMKPLRAEMIPETLAQARGVLADSPVDVVSRPLDNECRYVWQKLLAVADGADLLVVGWRAVSRAEGLLLPAS